MGGHVIASFGVVAVDSFACLEWGFEKDKKIRNQLFFKLPAPFFFFFSFSFSLSLPRASLAVLPCDNHLSG